jgi:hypothetical protein
MLIRLTVWAGQAIAPLMPNAGNRRTPAGTPSASQHRAGVQALRQRAVAMLLASASVSQSAFGPENGILIRTRERRHDDPVERNHSRCCGLSVGCGSNTANDASM